MGTACMLGYFLMGTACMLGYFLMGTVCMLGILGGHRMSTFPSWGAVHACRRYRRAISWTVIATLASQKG